MRQSIAKRLTFWNIFWFWMAITFAVYKRISPLIHGQGKRLQA